MPMTMLLFVFISVVLLNEIEMSLDALGRVQWGSVRRFTVARQSTTMLIGLALIFLFSATEIFLFMSGKIYAGGIAYVPVAKVLLVIALCFLAVVYKVILSQETIVADSARKFRRKKIAILLAAFFLLCIFLSVLLTH